MTYWIERSRAAALENDSEREQLEKGAWRSLANSYGGTRASWIASEIKTKAVAKEGSEDFSFLLIRVEVANVLADKERTSAEKRSAITTLLDSTHPLVDLIRDRISSLLAADEQIGDPTREAILQTINDGILIYLGFDLEELKAESWSRAPRTEMMPDRFVLIGFNGGSRFEQSLFPTRFPTR